MNLAHLDWRVTSLLNEVLLLKEETLRYCRDTSNPFPLRWEAFKQFAKLGGKELSSTYDGWDALPLNKASDSFGSRVYWYDDFNVERYQTFSLIHQGLEQLLDSLWYGENGQETKLARKWAEYNDAEPNPLFALDWALTVYKEPLMIQAVEALIRDGVTSFYNDW